MTILLVTHVTTVRMNQQTHKRVVTRPVLSVSVYAPRKHGSQQRSPSPSTPLRLRVLATLILRFSYLFAVLTALLPKSDPPSLAQQALKYRNEHKSARKRKNEGGKGRNACRQIKRIHFRLGSWAQTQQTAYISWSSWSQLGSGGRAAYIAFALYRAYYRRNIGQLVSAGWLDADSL